MTRMDGGFFWGVATSAYQAEGGYNGQGEPQTNWAAAEVRGDVVAVGRRGGFLEPVRRGFLARRADWA